MRICSVGLLVLLATPLTAQVVHTRPAGGRAGAGGGGSAGTVAAIAPPPPVIVVPGSPHYQPPYQTGPAFYGSIPVVVLPDGRVYGDFGRGYEQIVRACPGSTSYTVSPSSPVTQPTVIQPTIVQPGTVVNQPLPYTPPVPNQQTASQQMLDQQARQAAVASRSTVVNSQSCWGRNGHGQVFVGRP